LEGGGTRFCGARAWETRRKSGGRESNLAQGYSVQNVVYVAEDGVAVPFAKKSAK